ncbi:site-2 protease family protein [Actinomadura madurae]|uniref:site-2 protease family protein n=1 Tax=Actinomadura madurae TaxID=1993 RepID=UPI0015EEA23F|nr:site-2 protease family protein [Actinomadura madurae]
MHWSVLVIMVLIAEMLARAILPAADPSASANARWAVAVVTAVLFMLSLAAHEFAHALVARHHGVRVGSITLWMLGGVAELDDEAPDARADLRIAGVGPLTSAAAAVVFAGASAAGNALGVPVLLIASLSWLAATNALIALFNLIPGAPLDGGRVLRALLWRRSGNRARATRAAQHAGLTLGRVLIGSGLLMVLVSWFNGLWLALVGWFIASSARAEENWTDLREAAKGLRTADVMTPGPDYGWSWRPVGTFIEDVAQRSRQSVFPVVDVAGDPVGAVTMERLARIPPREVGIALGAFIVPLDRDRIVRPEVPVTALISKAPAVDGLIAVVVSEHGLIGMVTTEDVEHLLQRGRLRRGSPATA